jgi:hypothetical protein
MKIETKGDGYVKIKRTKTKEGYLIEASLNPEFMTLLGFATNGDRAYRPFEDGYAAPSGPGGSDTRLIALSADVPHSNTGTYATVFTAALAANTAYMMSVRLNVQTNTAGAAVQVRARSSNAGTTGYAFFTSPTTATAASLNQIAIGTSPADTGETTVLAAANISYPIMIELAFVTGATPGDIVIEIRPEVAATVTAKKGSYYILSS